MTREEAIAILSDIRSDYNCFDENEEPKYHALSMAIEALKVDPKRGHWIKTDFYFEKCSNCSDLGLKGFKFCPNCGADMREVEE